MVDALGARQRRRVLHRHARRRHAHLGAAAHARRARVARGTRGRAPLPRLRQADRRLDRALSGDGVDQPPSRARLVRRGGDGQAFAGHRSRLPRLPRHQRPARDAVVPIRFAPRGGGGSGGGAGADRRQHGARLRRARPAHGGLRGDAADLRGAARAPRLSRRFRAVEPVAHARPFRLLRAVCGVQPRLPA